MLGIITHCNRPFNGYDRQIPMQSVAKGLFRVHSAWGSTFGAHQASSLVKKVNWDDRAVAEDLSGLAPFLVGAVPPLPPGHRRVVLRGPCRFAGGRAWSSSPT